MDFGNAQLFWPKYGITTPSCDYSAKTMPVVKLQANPLRVQEDIDDNDFGHNKGYPFYELSKKSPCC